MSSSGQTDINGQEVPMNQKDGQKTCIRKDPEIALNLVPASHTFSRGLLGCTYLGHLKMTYLGPLHGLLYP